MWASKKSETSPLSFGLTVLTVVLLAFSLITLTGAAQEEDTKNQTSLTEFEEKNKKGGDYSYTDGKWILIRNRPVLKRWHSFGNNPGDATYQEIVNRLESSYRGQKYVGKEPPNNKPSEKKAYALLHSTSDFSIRFNLEKGDRVFETYPLANFLAFYFFGKNPRLPGTLEIEVSGYSKNLAKGLERENQLKEVKAKKVVTHGPGKLDCNNCTASLFAFPYQEEDKDNKLHGPMYVKNVEVKVKHKFREEVRKLTPKKLEDKEGHYVGLRNINVFLDRSPALDNYEEAEKEYSDGNFDKALTLIESAILDDPYSPRMYLLKTKILKEQDKMDKAYRAIKRGVKVVEDFPTFILGVGSKTLADVYIEKARFDYRRGDWDKAISMVKKAIEERDDDDDDDEIGYDVEDDIVGYFPKLRRILPSSYVNFLAKCYLGKYESTDGKDEASFQKAVETTLQAVAESFRETLNYVQKFDTKDYRKKAISYLETRLDYVSEKNYEMDYTNKVENYAAYFSYASLLYLSGNAQEEVNENQLLKSYSAIRFAKKTEIKNEQTTLVKALESKVREGLRIQSEDSKNLEKEACKFFLKEPENYSDWIDFLSCESKKKGDG